MSEFSILEVPVPKISNSKENKLFRQALFSLDSAKSVEDLMVSKISAFSAFNTREDLGVIFSLLKHYLCEHGWVFQDTYYPVGSSSLVNNR